MESNGSNTMTDNGAINDANTGSINQDEQIMLQKQVCKSFNLSNHNILISMMNYNIIL